jgi:phosphoserine phosphatase RsbU/P
LIVRKILQPENFASIQELPPDKMPIAIHENMKSFSNQTVQLDKGDIIYLTSDGYEDQFGGSKNKKFMSKQLKELFVRIHEKPMNEQKEILETTLINWIGDGEQIDDITVFGLRL